MSTDKEEEGKSDAELVAILLENPRDEAAFEAVTRRHTDQLIRHSFRLVGDRNIADDVVSDVFIRLFEDLVRKGGERLGKHSFAGTLFMWTNSYCEIYRRLKGRCSQLQAAISRGSRESVEAEDRLDKKEQHDSFQCALIELNEQQPRYFQILCLRYVEGLDNIAIARIIGKTEGSVGTTLYRARAALRSFLEKGDTESTRGYGGRGGGIGGIQARKSPVPRKS